MKIVFLTLILCFQSFAQDVKLIELDVKGVELGNRKSKAIKKLGKPVSIKKSESEDCTTEADSYLFYSGLKLTLTENDKTKELFVSAMEINSSKWELSKGVKIGMLKKDVQERLGEGNKSYTEGKNDYISYWTHGTEAYAVFNFHKNKLVEIIWTFNFC